jgi:tubulin-like protein CetZ
MGAFAALNRSARSTPAGNRRESEGGHMKLVVVGVGQAGSNIADEFVSLAKWVWENRHIRIFTGGPRDPLYQGVFAINLGAADLYGLRHIPHNPDHSILLGTTDEFRGRGAGKVNTDGALEARRGSAKIAATLADHGNVYTADAIMVVASTAGGTGSGSVGVIVDLLKEEFNKPVFAMLVLPFQTQHNDPDSVVNTATCLKKMLYNSKADALFLVDNQKFVRKGESMGVNYSQINRRIVDSFMDLLCVGEEQDSRFIGEVLDANDVIRILHGPTAIGMSYTKVPVKSDSLWSRFRNNEAKPNGFAGSKEQIERAHGIMHQAMAELSIDCHYQEDGRVLYDAGAVLGMFSGPSHEATEEIVEMMDKYLAERVPGAVRRKGTYPGRTSDTIGVTVLVSNIGQSVALKQVEWFYEEAVKMMGEVKEKRENIARRWDIASQAAEQLPDL